MKITTLLFFMLNLNIVYSQNSFDYKKERHQFNIDLIKTNKKNKVIVEKITDNEEFEGKYLGEIKTSLGVEYYIVASSYVFDIKVLAKTENHIFIYNSKKQYVGYYYLSQMYELPKRLDKNKLYFNNKDCKEKIIINFSNGIPRAINLKCNNENNYYEFQS